VAYPEFAAMHGPYSLGGDFNSMNATIDPTREESYQFLDRLLAEMASLFPDPYFQAGGDEVNGRQWSENSEIQTFMKARGFKDKHDLQGYFTERVRQILAKHGKTMVGWDEVLQPNLSKDVVIQAWRSSKLVQRSAALGHTTLVSAGYYLDHNLLAATYYAVDPLDSHAEGLPPESLNMVKGTPLAPYITQDNVAVDSPPLTPGQEKWVAGGIACMWSEFVWNEKEEMMVWPRVAAIAERLWSPASVKDVASLYRRLHSVDADLEFLGLRHRASEALMLQRLAGHHDSGPLETLAETVEPLKNLARFAPRLQASMATGKGIDNSVVTTRFVDALPAESMTAHDFHETVHQMLAGGTDTEKLRQKALAKLTQWRDNDSRFQAIAQDSFLLKEVIPASQDLRELAETGLEALAILESGQPASTVWLDRRKALLAKHRKIAEGGANLVAAMMSPQPAHELMNVIAPSVEDLVNAAAALH
jgi:hexosaminidase